MLINIDNFKKIEKVLDIEEKSYVQEEKSTKLFDLTVYNLKSISRSNWSNLNLFDEMLS